MQYRLFQYPLPAESELAELNRFLSQHRVATVHQQVVNTNGGAMLVFVVEIASSKPEPRGVTKSRIDYRDVLSESDFQVFSKLRECRKELATEEGVPVYAVFSNAQLAQMVEKRMTARNDLANIEGVGTARAEKYADRLIPILAEAYRPEPTAETEGES